MPRYANFILPGLLLAFQASATTITTTTLPYVANSFSSVAVDPVTGKAYQTSGYTGAVIKTYASAGALDSATSDGTRSVTHYGTYLAANNDSLYVRSGSEYGTTLSKVSAVSGAVQRTVSVAGGMGGENGSDTFNWGGFSGVSPMNDGSKLYVVGGHASSSQWDIATFDYELNQTKTVTFDLLNGTAGYGFAVNGYVFFSDSYDSAHISRRVDAATGAVQVVDFTLAGLQNYRYITGASYDSLHDSLYLLNYGGQMNKVSGVAQQFGVQRNAVPEPGTLAMAGIGLGALYLARRRKLPA